MGLLPEHRRGHRKIHAHIRLSERLQMCIRDRFAGVSVAPGAVVKDSIVMPGARIEEGARVQYAIVSENSVIGANAVVGERPEEMENLSLIHI